MVYVPNVDIFIGQRATNVCPVYRCNVRDIFPIFSLQVFVVEMFRCGISTGIGNVSKLLYGQWAALYVNLLVQTLFARNNLTNRCRYNQIDIIDAVAILSRYPFLWWNNLSEKKMLKFFCRLWNEKMGTTLCWYFVYRMCQRNILLFNKLWKIKTNTLATPALCAPRLSIYSM